MACKVYCPTSVEQDIGVVPEEGYNPYFFPDEGAYLPFFFTSETFVKVLSSLVNGAAVTYGDEGRAVVWEFLRNVEFPVDMCQVIADCLNDLDSPARQALMDILASQEAGDTYITNSMGMTTEQIASTVLDKGCDASEIAGAVIAIVDTFDEYIVDAIQIIELGTNDEERIASFISGFPAFGVLPVDEVIDMAQDFLEDFSENYVAAITPEWKDEVSEALYCLALEQPDCKLTFELLYTYFQTRATSGLDLVATVYDLANFITGGDFANDELIASGMYAILLASLKVGQEFFGMNAPKIGAITRDAPPSSAWEDWDECDPPPPDPACMDLTASEHGWVGQGGTTWDSGDGFRAFYYVLYGESLLRVFYEGDPFSAYLERVVVYFSIPVTNVLLYQQGGGESNMYTGTPITEIEFSAETFVGWTNYNPAFGLAISVTTTGDVSGTQLLEQVCVYTVGA